MNWFEKITTFEKRKIMKITLLKKYMNHNAYDTIEVSDERAQYLIAVKLAVKSDNSVNNIVVTELKVIEPKKRGRKSSKK